MILNPTGTLLLNQDWLNQQVEGSISLTRGHAAIYRGATAIKCRWAGQTDQKVRNAFRTGKACLVIPHLRTDIPVASRRWLRYFLALAVQHKSQIVRFKVGDYLASEIMVATSHNSMRHYFKLNLQSPVHYIEGVDFVPSFFGNLGFSLLETSIVYRKSDKVYALLTEEFVVMAGPQGAVKNLQKKLAKYFEIKAVPNEFTYLGMHVDISAYEDGHSVSIHCDELVEELLESYAGFMDTPAGPADYPVNREDVDMALQIEEATKAGTKSGTKAVHKLSEPVRKLSEPLNQLDDRRFCRLVNALDALEDCGRMDICAVRAYLELHVPLIKAPRKIHWKMVQQLCHYLKSGPPYRLSFQYKPKAELNAITTTRWFPLPIEVFAWYLGDCPIQWEATPKPSAEDYSQSGIYQALKRVLDEGADVVVATKELGLFPSKSWRPEMFTLVSGSAVYDRLGPVPAERRCEPFAYAKPEDAKVDFGRSVDQLQAESERRAPISRELENSVRRTVTMYMLPNIEDMLI